MSRGSSRSAIKVPAPPVALARYLIGPAGLVAAGINIALNYGAGQLLFARRDLVPLAGARGAFVDTFVGFALIAVVTGLLITPAVRKEVRAGRLPGRRTSAPARRWLVPHDTVGRAFALGLALAAILGTLAAIALWLAAPAGLPGPAYVPWKASLAGGCALIVTPLLAWIATRDEPDRYAAAGRLGEDERSRVRQLYEYLDKGCLTATSREHGCSNAPTWQLVVRGTIEPHHLRQAIEWLLQRYPSCRWITRSVDAAPEAAKTFVYVEHPDWSVDDFFRFVDLSGAPPDAADRLARTVHDRFIDLFSEPALHFTLARLGADESRLLVKQHHALADGRAFIHLLHDLVHFVECARTERTPAPARLAPCPRRPELEALTQSRGRQRIWALAGMAWTVGTIARAIARPMTPLLHNLSNDYRGSDGVVHWVVPDSVLDAWNHARKDDARIIGGASLNSFLAAAFFTSAARWSRAHGVKPGRSNAVFVAETRPRDGSFVSFANHFTSYYTEPDLADDPDPLAVAGSVHAAVRRAHQRSHQVKKLLAETAVSRTLGIDAMRRMVFDSAQAPVHFNFSNLIPIAFEPLEGGSFRVEQVRICTPCTPRCGIVLTVIRYGGELVFNFNYKASSVSRERAEELVGHFADTLAEMSGHSEPGNAVTAGDDGIPDHRPPQETPTKPRLMDRVQAAFSGRRARPIIIAAAATLALACLDIGFVADDHIQRAGRVNTVEFPLFERSATDVFHFADGSEDTVRTAQKEGVLSWWAAPTFRLHFWRPLTSLSHSLDYWLWPDAAWAMHLHDIAWFVALLAILAALYRRFHPGWVGVLALALYALDDAHGPALGWIANRNAFVAATFAAAALWAHDRWRRDQWPLGAALAAAALGLALLSGEIAVGALGYLAAYALFVERGPLWRKAVTLVPYALVFVVWAAVYQAGQYGARESGLYINPLSDPGVFTAHAVARIPVLLMGQFGAPWSVTANVFSGASLAAFVVWALAVVGAVAWIAWPVLKRSRTARFWAAGCVLASVPVAGTFPSDRLLVVVGIGAMGLLASVFEAYAQPEGVFDHGGRKLIAAVLIGIHLFAAPTLLPLRARSMETVSKLHDRLDRAIPRTDSVADKTVIVVHAPADGLVNYFPIVRASQRLPRPATLRLLATGLQGTDVKRTGPRTLEFDTHGHMLGTPAERLTWSEASPFRVGDSVDLADPTVEILEVTSDGRPARIAFEFSHPLEHDGYEWIVWNGESVEYDGFVPPEIGETTRLAATRWARVVEATLHQP